ncbi:MAG: hypothetical protein ACKVP5_16040 [Aestuariivirga sp.]
MAKTSRKNAGQAKRGWRLRTSALALAGFAFAATPAAGESVFEALYPTKQGQVQLPTPFAALLDELKQKTGNAEIGTAFIPLGRSLQRCAAHPDYFASPRIVVAFLSDGGGAMDVRSRLFLGYQPASGSIEIIAFDESEGRFVFQEVTGYEAGKPGTLQKLTDEGCGGCHQGTQPIFAVSPWSESNANPEVAAKLGESFQGLAVRQNFDEVEQINSAVRRASRLQAAANLWQQGCVSRACRASLLGETLRYRLATEPQTYAASDTSFMTELAAAYPNGLSLPSVRLPDHDPLALVAAGTAEDAAIETTGALNPETVRGDTLHWPSGPGGPRAAVLLISDLVSPAAIASLKQQLPAGQDEALAKRLVQIAEGSGRVAVLDGSIPNRQSLEALFKQALAGLPKSGEAVQ